MALSSTQIKDVLAENGLSPNRALGQNFCVDTALLQDAVVRAGFSAEPVLEIGPGLGALTAELLAAGSRVTAVEKDAVLAALLPRLLPDARLSVLCADVLRTDPAALFSGAAFSVAGNLPYYITTAILERFLPLLPETMLLMVQREAAARFFAQPGDRVYGPVAVLTRLYYAAETLCSVPPSAYWPQPEVDSAIVLLKKRDAAALAALPAPETLLRFVHAALMSRRKTLQNNFRGEERLPAVLRGLGLPENVRAEALEPEQLASICKSITTSSPNGG